MEQKDYEKIFEEYKQESQQQAQIEAGSSNPDGKEEVYRSGKMRMEILSLLKQVRVASWIILLP